jgi:hypothetical protein
MLPVHVVEPTLVDEAGHCAARFFDLLSSAPDLRFSLWADRRVRTDLFARATVDVQPYFFRRLRRLQAAWLYRRLLRTAGTVYVPTAGYFDLRALDLAAGRPLGAHKACCTSTSSTRRRGARRTCAGSRCASRRFRSSPPPTRSRSAFAAPAGAMCTSRCPSPYR